MARSRRDAPRRVRERRQPAAHARRRPPARESRSASRSAPAAGGSCASCSRRVWCSPSCGGAVGSRRRAARRPRACRHHSGARQRRHGVGRASGSTLRSWSTVVSSRSSRASLFGLAAGAARSAATDGRSVEARRARQRARRRAARCPRRSVKIALTIVLMSGAALFGRSLVKLLSIQLGFQSEHRHDGGHLPARRELHRQRRHGMAFDESSIERGRCRASRAWDSSRSCRSTSGTASASTSSVSRRANRARSRRRAIARRAPAISRRSGFPLSTRSRISAPATIAGAPHVGMVNRAFAEAYFKTATPVGQSIIMGIGGRDTIRIVGEVGDVPIGNIDDTIPPTLYVPFAQDPRDVHEHRDPLAARRRRAVARAQSHRRRDRARCRHGQRGGDGSADHEFERRSSCGDFRCCSSAPSPRRRSCSRSSASTAS